MSLRPTGIALEQGGTQGLYVVIDDPESSGPLLIPCSWEHRRLDVSREDLQGDEWELHPARLPLREHHVLDLREDGWSIEHPQECRQRHDSLLDCPVHSAMQEQLNKADGPPESPGRYRIETPSMALIPEQEE